MSVESPYLKSSARRAEVALVEAILPGTRDIPAADEFTVAAAENVVAEFAPALLGAWRAAHTTLDAAAIARRGRPFHALDRDAQDRLLADWERDPVLRIPLGVLALAYKFIHFDKRSVYETLGGRLNVVQELEQPRWLQQIHRAEDWQDHDDVECDIVVVGTGAGGAVVGRELADRGHAVVFVEEGEHHRRDAFDGSSLRAHQSFYRGAFSVGNALMPIFIGRLVGGSTAVNGGTCFRTPPWVLDRWCEDLGTDEFSPSAMEPLFQRVESVLQVAPSERRFIGPIADIMARGCDALGWSHFAINRNAPGCEGTGFCDFGCRTDARRSTNISYVPPALERGAMLLTGLRANRVIVERGRAVGIEGVAKNGRTIRVRGRAVVFSGGAVPTPLFLLEQGICNTSGQVGRNLTLHPSSGVSALFDERVEGHKYIPQGYACDQFLREGMLFTAAQADINVEALLFPTTGRRLMQRMQHRDNIAPVGVLIADGDTRGRVWRDVGGLPAISYNMARDDVNRLHRTMVHAAEMFIAAGAREIYPVLMGTPVVTPGESFERFRRREVAAGELVAMSYHPLGTCKMGRDPRTSVVDTNHQTHDLPGLFIVDGSTVPGPLGVNPQLTIMTMATRAAARIADVVG